MAEREFLSRRGFWEAAFRAAHVVKSFDISPDLEGRSV